MTNRAWSAAAALVAALGFVQAGCDKTDSTDSPTLTSLAVFPGSPVLPIGATQTLSVTGTYSDGSTRAMRSGLTWSSSAPAVATVSPVSAAGAAAVVTARAPGTATITATDASTGKTGAATVAVPATLVSIAVTPNPIALTLPGGSQALTVIGTYNDASTKTLTSGLAFSSSAPGVAAVSAAGVVAAVAVGSATITATDTGSGKTSTTAVTVRATLSSISVAPASFSLAVPLTQQLTVTGTFSDSSTATLTSGLTYASSATSVATVSASGLVTAVGGGTTTITVTDTASGKTATASVTVGATLVSIAVAPATVSLAKGLTQQLTVTGTFSDSSTATLASGLTYASSATSVATVSASGLVTAAAVGTATITVTETASGKTAAAAITVSPATLASISAAPASVTLAVAGTQALTVAGIFTDASTTTLTTGLTFASSATGVATVSAAGVVTAVATGTATITVTDIASGKTATVAVTVGAPPSSAAVFVDDFAPGVTFAAFGGSVNNLSRDAAQVMNGRASLKVVYPTTSYTGGAFVAAAARDLTQYDALTFWAIGTAPATIDNIGIGNDSAAALFATERHGIAITTAWQKFIVPIPRGAKLTSVPGLFHFATGSQATPPTIWLNDIQYETLGSSVISVLDAPAPPSPAINVSNAAPTVAVGASTQVNPGTSQVFFTVAAPDAANPNPLQMTPVANRYFDFLSSDATVASVNADGVVTGLKGGTATITATLGAIPARGSLPVTVTTPVTGPTTIAPTPPARAPATVISLFSAAYTNVPVDTWKTAWSPAATVLTDPFTIPVAPPHDVKKYALSPIDNFVGVEFIANEVNATGMGFFHFDVWSPDANNFQVKLVDAGPDGVVGTGDDSAYLFVATGGSTPPLVKSAWVSYDVPLTVAAGTWLKVQGPADGVFTRAKLAQMVLIEPDPPVGGTFYIDNFYFHQ